MLNPSKHGWIVGYAMLMFVVVATIAFGVRLVLIGAYEMLAIWFAVCSLFYIQVGLAGRIIRFEEGVAGMLEEVLQAHREAAECSCASVREQFAAQRTRTTRTARDTEDSTSTESQ